MADEFVLSSFHQDLCNFLVTAVDDEATTDQTIIKVFHFELHFKASLVFISPF